MHWPRSGSGSVNVYLKYKSFRLCLFRYMKLTIADSLMIFLYIIPPVGHEVLGTLM